MSIFTIKSPKVYIDGALVSCYTNNVSISAEVAELGKTNFCSSGYEEYVPGLASWSADYSGFYYAGDNAVENKSFASIATTKDNNIMIIPVNQGTTGSIVYFGKSIATRYQALGTVGEVNPYSLSMRGNDNLNNGTVVLMQTIAASSNGGVYELGAPDSTGNVIQAQLQVTRCNSSGALVSVLQANSSSGYSGANPGDDIITFTNSTGVGSEFKTGAVESTDKKFFRIVYGATGVTANKEFDATIAVAICNGQV